MCWNMFGLTQYCNYLVTYLYISIHVSCFMFLIFLLPQMRTSVRSGTPVLMPATTPWAPTTAPVPEASQSQLMAGPVRVHNTHTQKEYIHINAMPRFDLGIFMTAIGHCLINLLLSTLSDIDECSLGGNVCHDGQDCENTIGSYRCVMRCGRGFRRTADGLSCAGTVNTLYRHLQIFLAFPVFVNIFVLMLMRSPLLRCERVSGGPSV